MLWCPDGRPVAGAAANSRHDALPSHSADPGDVGRVRGRPWGGPSGRRQRSVLPSG